MKLYSRRQMLKSGAVFSAAMCGADPIRAFAVDQRSSANALISKQILRDARLEKLQEMARKLLATGLSGGTIYPEVWIRDTNTFLEFALTVNKAEVFRNALLTFFKLQGPTGDIVDGYVPAERAPEGPYRTSPLLPGLSAFKNSVETDQETSLVQAVCKYARTTRDYSILEEQVMGAPVEERLEKALTYVYTERFDPTHGLVWGGTRVDWGDVQPETYPGVALNAQSHRAISIYDNAMFLIAIQHYLDIPELNAVTRERWHTVAQRVKQNVRKHLWDSTRNKFIPHIYLNGSPFPPDLDEAAIYYHGGTTIAIEAGILTRDEVLISLNTMRENVKAAHAGSIGLAVYPPYPDGIFKDPILRKPYTYQNGGDWDWFGGRMVQQLIKYDLVSDAYREIIPMVDRVIRAGDFYEWWSRDNEPRGSAGLRSAAGVLGLAIEMLRDWAKHNSTGETT